MPRVATLAAVVLLAFARSEALKDAANVRNDAASPPLINSFDLEKLGIGGLQSTLAPMFRRAFASRVMPLSVVRRLNMPHVKGILLYGPPGTGKTLIARKIGQMLNSQPPKLVRGPEVLGMYHGESEENIRKLFADAEVDQAAKGDTSPLHLIIFDEFDAICAKRNGHLTSRFHNGLVDQLLSMIDGVKPLNNLLVVGITNRKEAVDEAILRPGRLELHVEIGLPDEEGRHQILRIHTRNMQEQGLLHADVDLKLLAERTTRFSGAELEGLVRNAQSRAFSRHIDFENPTLTVDVEQLRIQMSDFVFELDEATATAAAGAAPTKEDRNIALRNGVIAHGPQWKALQRRVDSHVTALMESSRLGALSLLLIGGTGTGKSTAASSFAMSSNFSFVKVIGSDNMAGHTEEQKVQMICEAFDDAHASKLGVVVLDDLERLVEYGPLGGRYSNTLLQTILILLKRLPPKGSKVLVIATASSRDVVESLHLFDAFDLSADVPVVRGEDLLAVTESLGITWSSDLDKEGAVSAWSLPLPIKKLIFLLETAAHVGPDGHRILTLPRLLESINAAGLAPTFDLAVHSMRRFVSDFLRPNPDKPRQIV